jgi:hypothetical protein
MGFIERLPRFGGATSFQNPPTWPEREEHIHSYGINS